MIRLIINADDFGLTEGINRAIGEAHQRGILTSATLMTNGYAFASALEIAAQNPTLGVGIHLNLVQGKPVSNPERVPCLVDNSGVFKRSVADLIQADLGGGIPRDEIVREIRSQIEMALQHGLNPTHLDGHKHFHLWPPFFAIVVQLALEYKISAIRLAVCPVMRSWPTSDLKRDRYCQILKQYALGLLLSMLSRMNRSAGFPSGLKSPDFFWGISQTGFLDEQSLHHILGKLKPGVNELMCHPGYVDQTPREFPTRLLSQREIEMEALTSPAVRKTIKARQINMIHYGNI
jgi:hopanoid biosynthesis associated protein HpnK